jgi:hypothetical protein
MNRAKRIVEKIEADFTDRRGLRQEWDNIDEQTKSEIRATWMDIIEREMGNGEDDLLSAIKDGDSAIIDSECGDR